MTAFRLVQYGENGVRRYPTCFLTRMRRLVTHRPERRYSNEKGLGGFGPRNLRPPKKSVGMQWE
ncbi:hypothetical protein GGD56_007050 [Rhizobium mongolense]|uniref:Uncharacterized protein n=2 Tax=Rhizobium mongolense TaxID=57676 RepID=A0ABR6IZ41_9HYPH|nr:hypothetical protein [Rhizobium mongolense]TVZ75066.1 hypothetical protein BCL32_0452 [Rhizobium mongolense USDA 1844]